MDIVWETFINVPDNTAIPAQDELDLVLQTSAHLERQGHPRDRALELLKDLQRQKSGVRINIEYTDIFGNTQIPLTVVLD